MLLLIFFLSYIVVDIEINAKWTDAALILQTAGLQEGEELKHADVQSAIANLARLKLFNNVSIDTSVVGDGIYLAINVDEAPFLKSAPVFQGNSRISDKTLTDKLSLRFGQVLTEQALFESRNAILGFYKEKSFYSTTVSDSLSVDTSNRAQLFFIVEEGFQPRIGKIDITGNNVFTGDRIRKLMQNKPKGFLRSGKLDEEKLAEDMEKIKSFYMERGHLDVKIDDPIIEVEDNRFVITVNIEENRKYYMGDISFGGNSVFSARQIEELVKCESGDVYNIASVDESQQSIMAAYADDGYIYASVVPIEDVRDSLIDIHYLIKENTPARINLVRITSNKATKENVIRRELVTIPGQRFRRSEVMRSMRELMNLGFFEDVQPITGAYDDSGNIDLVYQVKEKEGLATFGVGLSYSATDKLTGYVELMHPNIFGRGQKIHTKFEIGGRLVNCQLGFTEPWLYGARKSFSSDVYYTNRQWDYYNKKDLGFVSSISSPCYLDYARLGYSLRMERTQVFDIDDSYTAPSSGYSLYDDTMPRWTIANAFTLTRDSRDYIFNPTRGAYLGLNAEIAKKFLFADVDYNKFTFEVRAYFPMFWKFVLMTRAKMGIVTSVDEVPYYKRFYAGGIGDYCVRGYPDRSLSPTEDGQAVGGNAVWINNIELKCKLSQSLAFLLFYDAGNAFSDHRDVNLQNFYRGAGVGIRAQVPMMGVLGFDLGYGFDREIPGFQFHFQINPLGMF